MDIEMLNKEVARYQYISYDGDLLFEKIRYEPKTFRIVNPVTGTGNNGHSGALYNTQNLKNLDGKRVYIVEGEKDVDTMTILGLLACTVGGAANWPSKNNDLFIGAHVCILPDNDEPGRFSAEKIKISLEPVAYSVKIMLCPEPFKDVSDWVLAGATKNDVEKLFDSPIEHKFKTIGFDDLLLLDMKPNWLIKNYIESNGLCQIFGASGSGKSFFALDQAFCVSAGIKFFGAKTRKSNVLFIAGEGFSGLKKRAMALKNKYDVDVSCLDFSLQAAEIMSEDCCKDIHDRIRNNEGGYDLVYIDTLNRNMGKGDENSTKDMTTFIGNIDKYIRSLGCAVVIVHHTGLSNPDRGRGSGAMYNALDSEFKVIKDDGLISVTCTKQKEGESLWVKELSLRPVIVGYDDNEKEDIYSCIIVESSGSDSKSLKKRDQDVFDSLKHAIIENGIDLTIDDELNIIAINESEWREEAYKRLDGKNLRRDFITSKKILIDSGLVLEYKNLFYYA
jgi:hypothetical protein